MRRRHSSFLPAVIAFAALLASVVRWRIQASSNLYTTSEKRFYVPDVDLGWRVSSAHPIWLGLDACAFVAALVGALAFAGWLIRRREAKRSSRAIVSRVITWTLGSASLVIPIVAFGSGSRPFGAKDLLEMSPGTASMQATIEGRLEAPSGRYEVVANQGTSITAHLSAGGEPFDARFNDVRGFWDGDPRDLNQAMTAWVSIAAASVDTGVRERSRHARTRYLEADRYPTIEVTLGRLLAVRQSGPRGLEFRTLGKLSLIGITNDVVIAGTLTNLDPAAVARLGLTGSLLLVNATLSIPIAQTALRAHRETFDGDVIPISISLVLRHVGA